MANILILRSANALNKKITLDRMPTLFPQLLKLRRLMPDLHPDQIRYVHNWLRNTDLRDFCLINTKDMRKLFNNKRPSIRKQWELLTGKKWLKELVWNGKLFHRDANHLIPLLCRGEPTNVLNVTPVSKKIHPEITRVCNEIIKKS